MECSPEVGLVHRAKVPSTSAYSHEMPSPLGADFKQFLKGPSPRNSVGAEFVQLSRSCPFVLGCYSGILKRHINQVNGLVRR